MATRKLIAGGIAALAIAAASIGGFRFATGTWPDFLGPDYRRIVGSEMTAPSKPITEGKVRNWKHPSNDAELSTEPKTTADGRDFIPVYDDQAVDVAMAHQKEAPAEGRKVLYYRNPMGLADTSPVPKKDSMGMDYIPVYAGDDDEPSTVKVSAAKIQRTGVRTVEAGLQRVTRPVRAPGVAKPDQRTLYSVTLRADGFIEKLYVNEDGKTVEKGEPLFKIYSPDMVKVQVDYRISTRSGMDRDEAGAMQRLENMQLPKAVIENLQRTREPTIAFDWPSPVSGFILKKNAVEGMMMKAGDEIFRIADLSSIWVIADVAEQDIGQVQVGQSARIKFKAFPGEEFAGKVSFILPELDMATRTAKVRIQLGNPELRIKHEMFADVEINTGEGQPEQLAVPLSALIDSGKRQVVIVNLGDGRFAPREVKVGRRGETYVAITGGLSVGEKVVDSANFLIDAESNLNAALSAFSENTSVEEVEGSRGSAATPGEEHRP